MEMSNELLHVMLKSVLNNDTAKASAALSQHLEARAKALLNPPVKESLSANASTKEYIDDFIDSDAPQFKGKTKAKRIKMAVAASYKNKE